MIEALEAQGRFEIAERVRSIGSDWRATVVLPGPPAWARSRRRVRREAVGDQPFAVLLPDELMGSSSLLAHMNGVCAQLRRQRGRAQAGAPRRRSVRYGVIDPLSPVDADGVVAIKGMVEKPDPADAPSDLIIIGRYVLTPDVFDEIERLEPGRGGEIQLTDALRAQAARSPFHGVLSDVDRYDTGTPLGYLQAAVALSLRGAEFGADLATFLRGLPELTRADAPPRLGALETAGLVEHQPVLVDVELARRSVVEAGAPPRSRPVTLVAHAHDLGGERLDVDRHHRQVGRLAHAETESPDRHASP